jgi:glucokinase
MPKNSNLMIGIDLGGTKMMAAALDAQGKVAATRKQPTPANLGAEGVIREIAAVVAKLVKRVKPRKVDGICVGAPGAVDPKRGIVYHAPNLGWKQYPLAKLLGKQLDLPVTVDNDVNVGAVGEFALGAGKGARNLVAIFVGTGIGSGIIINGKLFHGSFGAAGEVGHVRMVSSGPLCGCGGRGCAEALASRSAMEKIIRRSIQMGRESIIPRLLEERNKDRITSSIIEAALAANDPLMLEVYERTQHRLGVLVADVINLLDPDTVVIGGGIAERMGEHFIAPIRETAFRHVMRAEGAEQIRIVPTALKELAGSIGAAVLAWQRFAHLNVGR